MWKRGENKVILMGRAGKDAEVRYTPNGTAIASLTLATEISYSDNEGKEQKKRNGMILSFWKES
uniref:single-stranded DNA-binding protein n=1 Tax=Klebsiella pneumoniae TaxID=573 RepID=UPI0022CE36DE|nr:Helix-destabilizing protein [Klebsiella pneumoniae]VXZ93108.1 Helix-destabilizing protein [Klebsiella pneumoniae]